MKTPPNFIENQPVSESLPPWEILTLERYIREKIASSVTQQPLYSENRRRLMRELRHEREILKIVGGYKR